MTKTIYFWILLALLVFLTCFFNIKAFGDPPKTKKYLQSSAIDDRQTIIYSADGKEKGYLQKSHIDPRHTIQYDKKGNEKGYWRKSYIDSRKTIFIEKE